MGPQEPFGGPPSPMAASSSSAAAASSSSAAPAPRSPVGLQEPCGAAGALGCRSPVAADALVAVGLQEPCGAAEALVPVRPPRPKSCCAWTNGYTFGVYTVQAAQYESMQAALEAHGTRKRCTGHAARIGKRVDGSVFLKCRLCEAEPPCKWMALLRLQADGSVHEMLGGVRSASVKFPKAPICKIA